MRIQVTLAVIAAALLPAVTARSESIELGKPGLLDGIPGNGPLTNGQIEAWLAEDKNHEPLEVVLPLGLSAGISQITGLAENPMTRAKVELGRQLYFDVRLSSDSTISCASCHHPDEGYGRHTQFGVGVRGQEGGRNSPVSYNRILSGPQFWDGRAASLEEQAVGPIANPIEMGNTHENAVATLKNIPGYVMQFEKIFGADSLNIDNVGKAIATFERAVVTGPSPYDYSEVAKRFAGLEEEDLADIKEDDPEVYAEYMSAKEALRENPMSESALRGQKLFFSAEVNCSACHVGANLTDEKYHNIGVGVDKPEPDVGRYSVTKDDKDWGAFKTPTIRNVSLSGPYMHDGSLKTLEQVIDHYAKGGTPNKNLSDKIKKFKIDAQGKQDLINFMKACIGDFPQVQRGRLPR